MTYLAAALILVLAVGLGALGWRALSRRVALPCPSWLGWMVDNPLAASRTNATLTQLELAEGFHVLDAGCGPGRLTIPIARAVGPEGGVLAVDLQPRMLRRVRDKAAWASMANVELLEAALGGGRLPHAFFDRAVLATVLGEIPDRLAALREIYLALKPGGFLLVNEVVGDPHYQSLAKVHRLAQQAGFQPGVPVGGRLSFSIKLTKPRDS
jgi:ubiquinone/menaquinone biosynthesis C-methylase UbiE